MGTLVYNDANIRNPTIYDFQRTGVPTTIISSPSYLRYFISSTSIVYFGAYNKIINDYLWHYCHYASSISTYVSYIDKVGSVFDNTIRTTTTGTFLSDRGIYVSEAIPFTNDLELTVSSFDTENDLYQAFEEAIFGSTSFPITYRLTNATTTGPDEAAVGDTVTVPLTFPEGYGVVNPSTDAYVTCNGVLVPSTYSNGQLVFTMPDPS